MRCRPFLHGTQDLVLNSDYDPIYTYSDPVVIDNYPTYYGGYYGYPYRRYYHPGVSLNFGFGGHRHHWR